MKTRTLVAASLTLNIALAAAWFLKTPSEADIAAANAKAAAAEEAKSGVKLTPEQVKEAALKAAILSKDNWAVIWSSDPKTLKDNLRAAGIPDKYIRSIVATSIAERFEARRKELISDEVLPYWKIKGNFYGVYNDKEKGPKLRALHREQGDAIKEALGTLGDDDVNEYSSYLKNQYGSLAKSKVEAIQRVQQDYSDMRMAITGGLGSSNIFPEDREKLALLEREQKADIAALLSPEELREYELRSSSTASVLRNQLAYFDASEAEYNTLFDLRKAYDDKYTSNSYGMGRLTDEQQAERSKAQKAVDEQIKAALGEARYAEFERSGDQTYQFASKIVERYNLPKENAAAVYDLRKSIDSQMQSIMSDKNLSQDNRVVAMQNLNADMNAKLTQYLGDKGLAAMKQSYSSYWIQNIERMTKNVASRTTRKTTPAN